MRPASLAVPRHIARACAAVACAITLSLQAGCLGWIPLPESATQQSRLPREMKPPSVPSVFEGESVITSTTSASRKLVVAKSADALVADDGSRCFASTADLARFRIGRSKWCLWIDPRPNR